jgi:aryl-alcohol dehydrogenase-like predicted oxidoreductase
METRALGKTGISVPVMGLSSSYGIDAAGIERAYHELGVRYFFVTPRTKPMVTALANLVRQGHREKLVIAAGANLPFGFSVPRAFDKIRGALGVDVIDVFHLFWVQAHWYVTGQTWTAMRRLKEERKVKALAVSIHDRPMGRALVDELGLDVLMIRYNAAHRGAEREIFDSLPDDPTRRPGIVAYTATRWGKLLSPAGEDGPMTAAECYRFALGHPKVDLVLSGAGSFEQARENAEGIAAGPLTAPRLEAVKRFGDRVRASASSVAFGR